MYSYPGLLLILREKNTPFSSFAVKVCSGWFALKVFK